MQQVATTSAPTNNSNTQGFEKKFFNGQEKPKDIRKSNIIAAKCIINII
jgi:hypothetical protein